MRRPSLLLILAALSLASIATAAESALLKFDFGPGRVMPGYTQVLPDMLYSKERGFGFEPGAKIIGIDHGGGDPLRSDFVTSDQPFCFTARVPREGNYRVTVTLGDSRDESTTTIKAELRRLMLERLHLRGGQIAQVSFIVNVRTPHITARGDIPAGEVKLKAPRETTMEALDWDDAITLEFNNTRPVVSALEIQPVNVPTIFVLGDSTVCDQPREPYNSWGQMLPRFFKPEIAVANHGESGETYRDSIGRRRLDKILSVMNPGDWVIMQFGHNDQKQRGQGMGPFLNYKTDIKKHVDAIRAHGGTPIIVSPMERRNFDDNGKVRQTLADYAEAAGQSAHELGVAFIDLHAMSIPFYEALEAHGHEYSRKAFAGKDDTHHDNYGSYELAKCVIQSIRAQNLPLAKFIVNDFTGFDPAHPDDVEKFAIPASADFTNLRPLGN
jgi:lysophospholipase L1-like esterase